MPNQIPLFHSRFMWQSFVSFISFYHLKIVFFTHLLNFRGGCLLFWVSGTTGSHWAVARRYFQIQGFLYCATKFCCFIWWQGFFKWVFRWIFVKVLSNGTDDMWHLNITMLLFIFIIYPCIIYYCLYFPYKLRDSVSPLYARHFSLFKIWRRRIKRNLKEII